VVLPGCPATSASTTARTSGARPPTSPPTAARRRCTRTASRRSPCAGDAGRFLQALAQALRALGRSTAPSGSPSCAPPTTSATPRSPSRPIAKAEPPLVDEPTVDPLDLCRRIEATLPNDSVLVADGGDFVATASYIVRPRGPLSWLDPGVFGTLGVGAGFALGAKLVRPDAEVWIVYGDGSVGYSLAEFDTFVRHKIPVIALVGNDASWAQIARDQVEILGDAVGTELRRTDYTPRPQGFGGVGIELRDPERIDAVLAEAKAPRRRATRC
jgi:thiamine pyrophosphate-dependent acetolactate synthase large subunit-like protein